MKSLFPNIRHRTAELCFRVVDFKNVRTKEIGAAIVYDLSATFYIAGRSKDFQPNFAEMSYPNPNLKFFSIRTQVCLIREVLLMRTLYEYLMFRAKALSKSALSL